MARPSLNVAWKYTEGAPTILQAGETGEYMTLEVGGEQLKQGTHESACKGTYHRARDTPPINVAVKIGDFVNIKAEYDGLERAGAQSTTEGCVPKLYSAGKIPEWGKSMLVMELFDGNLDDCITLHGRTHFRLAGEPGPNNLLKLMSVFRVWIRLTTCVNNMMKRGLYNADLKADSIFYRLRSSFTFVLGQACATDRQGDADIACFTANGWLHPETWDYYNTDPKPGTREIATKERLAGANTYALGCTLVKLAQNATGYVRNNDVPQGWHMYHKNVTLTFLLENLWMAVVGLSTDTTLDAPAPIGTTLAAPAPTDTTLAAPAPTGTTLAASKRAESIRSGRIQKMVPKLACSRPPIDLPPRPLASYYPEELDAFLELLYGAHHTVLEIWKAQKGAESAETEAEKIAAEEAKRVAAEGHRAGIARELSEAALAVQREGGDRGLIAALRAGLLVKTEELASTAKFCATLRTEIRLKNQEIDSKTTAALIAEQTIENNREELAKLVEQAAR